MIWFAEANLASALETSCPTPLRRLPMVGDLGRFCRRFLKNWKIHIEILFKWESPGPSGDWNSE